MKELTRAIGSHIRIHQDLKDVTEAVERLDIDVAQSFLITESNEYIAFSNQMIDDFVSTKKKLGFEYYVHAAYWSGVTDSKSKMFQSLRKEVELSQDLHADGIVIHPGATKVGISAQDKIRYVAECVNIMHQEYPDMPLLLENGPHKGRSFGGNLEHFALLIDHIENKSLLRFCIDTAHAFVYGYNITKDTVRADFLKTLEDMFSKQYIQLLHFNDSRDKCGSYIDKHVEPGHGLIGKKALQDIMNHELFKDVSLLMECSKECNLDIADVIAEVKRWEE